MAYSTALAALIPATATRFVAATIVNGQFTSADTTVQLRNSAGTVFGSGTTFSREANPDSLRLDGSFVLNAAPSGALFWRVLKTSSPTIYADFEISAQLDKDGFLNYGPGVPGDTVNYQLTVRQVVEVAPLSYFPRSMKVDDTGSVFNFPYVSGVAPGAKGETVPIRFFDTANTWNSFSPPSPNYNYNVEYSVNNGPWTLIASTVMIDECSEYRFRAPTTTVPGGNVEHLLFIDGPANTSASPTPILSWRSYALNSTRAPATFLATPANIQSLLDNAVGGDVINLTRGVTYPGFRINKSGNIGAPITIQSAPGSGPQAKVFADASNTANYSYIEAGTQIYPESRFLIFGGNGISHITIKDLEITSGRYVPALLQASTAIRISGGDWLFEGNYVHDSDMGIFSGDYHTGWATYRLNWVHSCGRMASFNSHSMYINNAVAPWPDKAVLVEWNLVTNSSGGGVNTRGERIVSRNNWIELDRTVIHPNHAQNQGTGLGGQLAIGNSGNEQDEAVYGVRRPQNFIYGNVCIVGNDWPIILGADWSGAFNRDDAVIAHNTFIMASPRSPYLALASARQSTHCMMFYNNIFAVENNTVIALDAIATVSTGNLQPNLGGLQMLLKHNSFQVPWLEMVLNNNINIAYSGNVRLNAPIANATPGAFNVTPVGACIGAATPITYPNFVLGVAPLIVNSRMWATKPTFPLVPPPSAGPLTNIGSL